MKMHTLRQIDDRCVYTRPCTGKSSRPTRTSSKGGWVPEPTPLAPCAAHLRTSPLEGDDPPRWPGPGAQARSASLASRRGAKPTRQVGARRAARRRSAGGRHPPASHAPLSGAQGAHSATQRDSGDRSAAHLRTSPTPGVVSAREGSQAGRRWMEIFTPHPLARLPSFSKD